MKVFKLKIELENDALQYPHQLGALLTHIREQIYSLYGIDGYEAFHYAGDKKRRILDANGNTVGKWKIREE